MAKSVVKAKSKGRGKPKKKVKKPYVRLSKAYGATKLPGQTNAVSTPESEAMFELYYECGSYDIVAKAFHRSPTTVKKHSRKNKWLERKEKIKEKVQEKTEKNTVKRTATKIKMASSLVNATFSGLFKQTADGETILAVAPSVSDAIRASQYEEQLREKYGLDDVNDETSTVGKEIIELATVTLTTIGENGLKALGDWLVKHAEHPEDKTV